MTSNTNECYMRKCSACGTECGLESLKSASVPNIISLLAATDVEPDDTEPPLAWIDARLYCPRCRRIENVKRCMASIAILIFFTFGAVYVHRLLWG